MADADGATKFSDIEKVEAALCDLSPKPVWKCFVFVFFNLFIYLFFGSTFSYMIWDIVWRIRPKMALYV